MHFVRTYSCIFDIVRDYCTTVPELPVIIYTALLHHINIGSRHMSLYFRKACHVADGCARTFVMKACTARVLSRLLLALNHHHLISFIFERGIVVLSRECRILCNHDCLTDSWADDRLRRLVSQPVRVPAQSLGLHQRITSSRDQSQDLACSRDRSLTCRHNSNDPCCRR